MKRYTRQRPPEINYNASLWKWLFIWMEYLYRYRKDQYGFIPNALLGAIPPNRGIYENHEVFTTFVRKISTKIFGVQCVNLKIENKVIPVKFAKGVKTSGDRLVFYSVEHYNQMLNTGAVAWCPINKDWYMSDCFLNVFNYKGEERHVIRMANPKYFTCPCCGASYLEAPHNKIRNPFSKLVVCLRCKDEYPKNPAPTQTSIYGEYHSHYRTGWKFFSHYSRGDSTVPMGVELEIQSKAFPWDPREKAWALCLHQQAANPNWNLFYCERDGSIGEYGLEMITQPMSQQLHYQFWNHMLPAIRENFTGWNTKKRHPGGQYGIHITFDSTLYGQLNLARLAKFIESKKNQVFIQGMAQRGILYGNANALAARDKAVKEVFVYENGKLLGSQNRNQAINLKKEKGLCEIRMFRSTLNTTSFFKNLEFLWAFRHWAGETPWDYNAESFLNWLLDSPKLYNVYPHLYEYMCHEHFPVDPAQWMTKNIWAPHFTALVDKLKKGQKDLFLSFTPENTDYTP